MEFNLTKIKPNPKLGDMVYSFNSGLHYMIIEVDNKYRLLCLEDATAKMSGCENIETCIKGFFSHEEYDIIQHENIVLSNIK